MTTSPSVPLPGPERTGTSALQPVSPPPAIAPGFRPVACLEHGLTWGAEVVAVVGETEVPFGIDLGLATLAVAAMAKAGPPTRLVVDLSSWFGFDLVSQLSAVLDRHEVPADALSVRVSAAAAASDPKSIVRTFERLRRLGFRTGLGEVGTTLGSLLLLSRLPLDFAELEPGITDLLLTGTDGLSHGAGVLERMASAGIESTATGVASHDQAVWLRDLGCRLGQGSYFGTPSPWLMVPTAHACVRT